jgi:hypothetical protein
MEKMSAEESSLSEQFKESFTIYTFPLMVWCVDICALLGHYAAPCGNCLPAFRENVLDPSSRVKRPKKRKALTLEYGTDSLSRKVGKQLPLDAA